MMMDCHWRLLTGQLIAVGGYPPKFGCQPPAVATNRQRLASNCQQLARINKETVGVPKERPVAYLCAAKSHRRPSLSPATYGCGPAPSAALRMGGSRHNTLLQMTGPGCGQAVEGPGGTWRQTVPCWINKFVANGCKMDAMLHARSV